MDVFINKTSRAITVGGVLLVPGKKCQLKDVDKLKKLYPRFAELLEQGDIAAAIKDEPVKAPEYEAQPQQTADVATEEPKSVRRKRV